ncbi:hypothetical protein TWF696_005894 [Orbilia brochopaga]|uniref:C2H2-type domain-containing protein n=1 Tax=Orbilia brochopaga TaxID=3140254 RepID=A0AAV9UUN7_9PEZI
MSKRPRDDTDSTALPTSSPPPQSQSPPPPYAQPAKYARSSHSPPPSTAAMPTRPSASTSSPTTAITCTLPSCPQREHGNVDSYETHYAKHHTNRCTDCGKNFPAARILECHIRENHDMFAVLAREKGEKIYACFLDSCDKVCISPGKRRAHLIDKHHYPPTFNFFIVNDGIDRATSLLASSPQRKSRTRVRRVSVGDSGVSTPTTAQARRPPRGKPTTTASTTTEQPDGMDVDVPVEKRSTNQSTGGKGRRKHTRSASEPLVAPPATSPQSQIAPPDGGDVVVEAGEDADIDMTDLTARMSAIRFVPPSVVRFGRRGGGGGFSKK